jgi:Uma2 family endonuclease
MNLALAKPMTLAEFLAWEERQELRHEFDGLRSVAMTGGTYRHDRVTFGLQRALDRALRGTPCRPCGPNMKILTGAGTARYPDALIVCMPIDPRATVAEDPVAVFEVVSEGTSRTDRIVKLREYQAVPSIRRYVILEQDAVAATVFERRGADWVAMALTEADRLAMPEVGIELPLAEIYEGIEFGPEAREQDPPTGPQGERE